MWIEVFRSGNYGAKGSYTDADLDRMASNYDPALHEAPAVIGHPEHDQPAHGWVEGLARQGNRLLAKFKQLSPQLSDWLKSGAFKKRSISIYPDLNGKGIYLRHVGFLGAMPPEVKGLNDIPGFKETGGEFIALEFNEEENAMEIKEVKDAVVAAFKEMFGKGEATPAASVSQAKQFSEEEAKGLIAQAVTEVKTFFTEQLTAANKTIEKLNTTVIEMSQQGASQAAKSQVQVFCEKLGARYLPAFKEMGLVDLLESLNSSTVTLEFGEGESKKKQTQYEVLTGFLEQLPDLVNFDELAIPKRGKTKSGIRFNESEKTPADLTSIEQAAQAEAMAAEKKISFSEALKEVRRQTRSNAA
jgi:hypothetical protein